MISNLEEARLRLKALEYLEINSTDRLDYLQTETIINNYVYDCHNNTHTLSEALISQCIQGIDLEGRDYGSRLDTVENYSKLLLMASTLWELEHDGKLPDLSLKVTLGIRIRINPEEPDFSWRINPEPDFSPGSWTTHKGYWYDTDLEGDEFSFVDYIDGATNSKIINLPVKHLLRLQVTK